VSNKNVRQANVEAMRQKYPSIRVMGALSWRFHWDIIKHVFKRLRIPVCNYRDDICDAPLEGIGKYARWASLIFAFAYQRRFQVPCMILLEDDVELTNESSLSFLTELMHSASHGYKCGLWGECFVTNLKVAEAFHARMYKYGVSTHSDLYIMHHLRDVIKGVERRNAPLYKLLVGTGQGDIMASPQSNLTDFDYDASDDLAHMQLALSAFHEEDRSSSIVELDKAASRLM